jgi:adenylate kinase family enzyme
VSAHSSYSRSDPALATVSRVVVVGMSGSGKTTLAAELARWLCAPQVELDALHWGPGWALPTVEGFRETVAVAVAGERWVADGNYSAVRDMVWRRAELLVWLDYSLPVVMARLVRRTVRRCLAREELWNGNRERLWVHLFTRDSLWWWVLRTYRKRRRQFPVLLALPEYRHLQVVRLRSPGALRAWLSELPGAGAPRA